MRDAPLRCCRLLTASFKDGYKDEIPWNPFSSWTFCPRLYDSNKGITRIINMSSSSTTPTSGDLEKGRATHAERVSRAITPGGHPVDYSQPGIPKNHREYANPAPLGLTSFGCGFFIVSCFTLYSESSEPVFIGGD
jgi:hypothetical protein